MIDLLNKITTIGVVLSVVLIGAVLMLQSCKNKQTPIIKDFDRTGAPYTITVHTFKTLKEVRKAKKDFDGSSTEGLLGWAKWSNIRSHGCEIFVQEIESLEQKERMNTLAHELLHCLVGKLHEDGYTTG